MNEYVNKSMRKKRIKKCASFHYTGESMVKACLSFVPLKARDTVLDAGSGRNKIWFKNIKIRHKYECEIENGKNFYEVKKTFDWIVGNPPFAEGWLFLEKACFISRKGVAFLGNINFWNSLTPQRLKKLEKMGFNISHIHVTFNDRWYGRYYFIIFVKTRKNFISWDNGHKEKLIMGIK